jgi:RND superfamily putative drug exporter
MPALLLLLGPRVNALSPQWLQRSAGAISRPVLAGRWYRLAMAVMRRPVTVAVCAAAFLVLLGAPVLGIKLSAIGSASALPTSTSTRQVSDTIAANFKLDPEHVIEVVSAHATNSQLSRYRRALEHLPGQVTNSPFQRLKRHVAVMYIEPKGEAAGAQAQQLVTRIRDMPVPFERKVGGPAATFVDMKATMISNLLVVLIIVTVTTGLAVFLLTGSVVLPPKTVLMNTLTVTAALGVLVLVFQKGDPHWLLGSSSLGSVAVIQPVLLVAIAWGLSTDYGVFLLDRIREIHEDGASNEQAIALGLERTGRITTTAALLLCVAIGSLVTSRLPNARELAVAIVSAVLLDATVVRALLVPALMRLLGEANWWSPAPVRKLHRRLTRRSASRRAEDADTAQAQQQPATVGQQPQQPAPERVG